MGTFSFHPMGNDNALNVEDDFLSYIFKPDVFDGDNIKEITNHLLNVSVKEIKEFISKVDSYYHYVIPYVFEEYEV